ncbi:NHL-repeat-containing protein [Cotonvirus japonicus]|uniref:NHL-repeat-containing protein n=1 Tax=Cotonvirus japonicus TaxID=2811091 RepID=A0ABM7NU81_9VIRU|nr:NHL-repeat-containing protein [Cotonvirus japonicus]BCS83621.1 NHL-repeat-containing protein [Cotonvirus japonicus]
MGSFLSTQPDNFSSENIGKKISTWNFYYLISNKKNSAHYIDNDLLNPYGIIIHNDQLFVVNNGSNCATNYDLFGNKLSKSISIHDTSNGSSGPTAIVVNENSKGFIINDSLSPVSGLFLICTQHGTIHSHNPRCNSKINSLVMNRQLTGEISVYRGLAICKDILYVANFFQGCIDVFDSNYNRLFGFPFKDTDNLNPIPKNYGPINIINNGDLLYVVWAKKNPGIPLDSINGDGYISVFNLNGYFVNRFTNSEVLNNPYDIIPAPHSPDIPKDSILVSNHGDGKINIFSKGGLYIGPLLCPSGLPLQINGLRGLTINTNRDEIFFTAANVNGTNYVGHIVHDNYIDI